MQNTKILIVDDNVKYCRMTKKYLELKSNIVCDIANNKGEALECVQSNLYQAIILDIELEDCNGLELINDLKLVHKGVIIFVSGRTDLISKLTALKSGAIDYVTKPYHLEELLLRLQVHIEKESDSKYIYIDEYKIDEINNKIYRDERLLDLQSKAYKILRYLLVNKGRVISREELYDTLWNGKYKYSSRVVDTHISLARNEANDCKIRSVRGKGYLYCE